MLVLGENGIIVLQTILLQESSITVGIQLSKDTINASENILTYPLAWISVSMGRMTG